MRKWITILGITGFFVLIMSEPVTGQEFLSVRQHVNADHTVPSQQNQPEFAALSDEEKDAASSSKKRMQSIYLEFLGNGITYSFNYDIRFLESDRGPGARIGVSGFAVGGNSVFTFPVMGNYLLGADGKYFEVGIGATYYTANVDFLFAEPRQSSVIGTMVFGYRKQPVNGGFLFKASFVPVFGSFSEDFYFIPYYVGIGIGYAFTYLQAT